MPPRTGTREEWLRARRELLAAEKEHTRRSDELARRRGELPWVPIDKDYRFQSADGEITLADLFRGRSQLIVHHFMFPGCPSCGSVADGYEGFAVHLAHHDVAMARVSRYPVEELVAFNERMGWSVPWVSSLGSDFGFDFGVAFTDEQIESARAEHNIHSVWDWSDLEKPPGPYAKYDERPLKDLPGVSCFALENGVVHHTYSAYARGTDVLWGMYQWLDRAPKGRNESGPWFRVRDEYDAEA
jgi:predicted dithiol-disulfide oxidoreductase (DUF899 family)